MEKLLKILAAAVIMFLLYLWGTVLFKSCNDSGSIHQKSRPVVIDSKSTDEITNDNDLFDEDFEPQDETDEIDYTEIDKTFEKTKIRTENNPNPSQKVDPSPTKVDKPAVRPTEVVKEIPNEATNSLVVPKSDPNGRFLVIAGSFKEFDNAQKRVNELKKLKFLDAEATLTPFSENYLIIAGRFNTRENAQKLLNALKVKKIDAYIKERK